MAFFPKILSRFKIFNGRSLVLSVPILSVLGIIFICALAWFFFMGYMVGKGQHPQNSINDITGLGTRLEDDLEKMQAEKEVMEALNNSRTASQNAPVVMSNSGQIPAKANAEAYPFNRPQNEAEAAWERPDNQQTPKSQKPAQTASSKTAKAPTSSARYDFTYQTAAFKTNKEAIALKDRLQKDKINASVQKNGRVFLVLLKFRGSDQEAISYKQKLQKYKLGAPLLISKTSVNPAKKGKK